MWALLAGIAAACGLVLAAAGSPARREANQRRYLARLAARLAAGDLLADQAADGSVLARKFKEHDLERKFKEAEATLRRPSGLARSKNHGR